MECLVCGSKMTNTTGGNYTCPMCGAHQNDLVFRPGIEDNITPKLDVSNLGWICPKCGRVLAPFVSECTCSLKLEVEC